MTRARAAVADGLGHFTLEDIEVGEPQAGEVAVTMRAAGVCHTDWDSLSWGRKIVLGHEGAGVVRAVGPGVSRVRVGDAVVLNWAIPCGTCFQCERGAQSLCEINSPVMAGNAVNAGHVPLDRTTLRGEELARSFHLGTLSEITVVREEAVVKLTHELPFPWAAVLGCGVMTGYGSVVNAAKLVPGSSVTVLGTGGVGLSVVQACRIAGARQIIAVDLHPQRLALAAELGATHTLLARRDDAGLSLMASQVKALSGGRGTDYAFECTAVPALGAAPLAMIRNGGCAVAVSGIEQEITVDMRLFEWDKIYINPLYGQCRPQIDLPQLMDLCESGDLRLEPTLARPYALGQLAAAFEDMQRGDHGKGVIVFS